MRLSLRTLLAYEDKVFDIERQRQLEKLIRQDDASVLTLRRIRGIVRQPNLGVPGRIQQREELDPNVVAEYLDEGMQPEIQERFEKFCLSSDKFLAEVASVHQILSNVLGEPARTSRECRLRCYEANRRKFTVPSGEPEIKFFEPEPQAKPEVVLLRAVKEEMPVKMFVNKQANQEETTLIEKPEPERRITEKESNRKNPFALLGFIMMLVFPAGFLLGIWLFPYFSEQDNKTTRPSVSIERPPMVSAPNDLPKQEPVPVPAVEKPAPKIASPPPVEKSASAATPPVIRTTAAINSKDISVTKIEVARTPAVEREISSARKEVIPAVLRRTPPEEPDLQEKSASNGDPFLPAVPEGLADKELSHHSSITFLPPTETASNEGSSPRQVLEKTPLPRPVPPLPIQQAEAFDAKSLIAFQPLTAPPIRKKIIDFDGQRRLEVPQRDVTENRQISETDSVVAGVPIPAQRAVEWSIMPGKVISPETAPQEPQSFVSVGQITEQTENSAVTEKSIGRVLLCPEPVVVFFANSSSDQWGLKPLPFNIFPEQYLLTIAPFRAELEFDGGLLIEMVGDSKLCALPPDENGIPGIFVDYGRIVIRQKSVEQVVISKQPCSLRIQTEKIDGIIQFNGHKSSAFIDTFADVLEKNSDSSEQIQQQQDKNKTVPVLGFVPEPGQTILWYTAGQTTPVSADSNRSIQLIPNRFELGSIQGLPAWQQRSPLPKEAEVFAGVCRRTFHKHQGNCETSLEELSGDTSPLIRSFGLRLWGDLGRFDIPLALLTKTEQSGDPIRQVLVSYFREVMKRDEESVQRLSDAMEAAKQE